jgi:hypothetical protein
MGITEDFLAERFAVNNSKRTTEELREQMPSI